MVKATDSTSINLWGILLSLWLSSNIIKCLYFRVYDECKYSYSFYFFLFRSIIKIHSFRITEESGVSACVCTLSTWRVGEVGVFQGGGYIVTNSDRLSQNNNNKFTKRFTACWILHPLMSMCRNGLF